jgi:hypothetical protein
MNKISYAGTIYLPKLRVLRLWFSPGYSADRSLIISANLVKFGSSCGFKESSRCRSFVRNFFQFFPVQLNKNDYQLPQTAVKISMLQYQIFWALSFGC